VTARQVPRTWATKSENADLNEEPPKEWPQITVATGMARARAAI
jgi:hypothetical protein